MRITRALPLLCSLLACTDGSSKQAPANDPPEAEPVEAAPTPAPVVVRPDVVVHELAPTPVEPAPTSAKSTGWTIQYDRLHQPPDTTLRRFEIVFSVHDRQLGFSMLGEFSSAVAAQAELDRLTAAEPRFAGFVRDLSRCNLRARDDTTFDCRSHDADGDRLDPLVVYPPRSRVVDPASLPAPDPLVHPPAQAVLVVASNEVFTPGRSHIDRAPLYKSWIWTPDRGPLPSKAARPDVVETEPVLEQLDGLFVFADGERQALVAGEASFEFGHCDCSDIDDKHQQYGIELEDVKVAVRTLEIERDDGARSVLLTPSAVPKILCIDKASAMQADYQVAAVAGPRVFVVERQRASECGKYFEVRMKVHVFDLEQGPVELAVFERELPAAELVELREQAARALAGQLVSHPWDSDSLQWWDPNPSGSDPGWAARLWPDALVLSGLFPNYQRKHSSKGLILQYQMKLDSAVWEPEFNFYRGLEPMGMREGSKDWSTWTWTTRVAMPLPESSSLRPPDDAQALIDHVAREHRDWKVIGWSRRM